MRFLLPLLLLFGFSNDSFGQKSRTIRLIDGSYLRGKVIDEVGDTMLQIKLSVGDTILISENSVFSSTRTTSTKKKYSKFGEDLILKKGIYTYLYGGLLIGSSNSSSGFTEVRRGVSPIGLSVGYSFNQRWSLGAGTSIDFLQSVYFPVYIETRYNLAVKKISPFVMFRAGYAGGNWLSNNFEENHIGGPMINPSLGFQFASKSKNNLTLQIGLRYQRDVIERTVSRSTIEILRYNFSIGLMM